MYSVSIRKGDMMATNPYINRVDVVRGNSTDTLINISDTTAVASDVASGKYFYLASGEKVAGTSSGGGSVTQDADGFIVLPETGGGGGSTGLAYETGTFTPTEDANTYDITFSSTHTTLPFYTVVMNTDGEYDSTLNSAMATYYINYESLFGVPYYISATSLRYGEARHAYRSTTETNIATSGVNITNPISNSSSSSSSYPRYWTTNSGMTARTGSGAYFRTGKTYRWIAVWAPTS